MSQSQPVSLNSQPVALPSNPPLTMEISGRLRDMVSEVERELAQPAGPEYVVNLAITLLHTAIGKEVMLADRAGRQEVFRLWRS